MSKKQSKPFQSRIVAHGEEAVDAILFNPANWRIHPKAQQDALEGVLSEVGWVQDVIVNRTTGHLVDGHLRCQVAARNGEKTVPVVYVELSEAEEALILASIDPIAAMAATDNAKLDALMAQVQSGDERVQAMMAEIAEKEGLEYGKKDKAEDPGAQIDKAEELRVKWGVEPGQLWQLGEHRLICGDCTDRAIVARLTQGETAQLLHADPPYGIDLLDKVASLGKSKKYKPVDGDAVPFDPQFLLGFALRSILWGANHYADKLPASPFWLVWDKQGGAKDTTFATCELAWCNDKQPARVITHVWDGFRRDSEKGEDRYHPTQKPVAVIEWVLSWVDFDVLLDFYSGTGPAVLACEHMGKKCMAIEKDPAYCAVILERWSVMTGQTPTLIDVS